MFKIGVLILALFVAACARTETSAPTTPAYCGATGYQGLVGAQLAAVTLPAGLNMAIVEFGAPPPSPVDPSRIIMQLDAQGRITRVYCG